MPSFLSVDSCTMLTCWAGEGKTLCLLSLAWVRPEPLCERCKAVAMETPYLFCGVLLLFLRQKRCAVSLCRFWMLLLKQPWGSIHGCCSSLWGSQDPLSMTPSRDPTWGNSLNGVKALSCSWTEDSPQSSQLASFSDPKETVLLLSPAHGPIGPEQMRLS